VVLFAYYVWANKQKDQRQSANQSDSEVDSVTDKWGNLTDKENARFRYVY
jgi:hypothetical protein